MSETRLSGRLLAAGRTAFVLLALLGLGAPQALAVPWGVLYDHSGLSDSTVSLRALARSSDGSQLYAGWLHWAAKRAVYRLDATTGAVLSTYDLATIQANTIATDNRGNVYLGYGENGLGQIEVRSATLAAQLAAPFDGGRTSDIEGLDVWSPSLGAYYLYASRADGTIQRFDVSDPTSPALDTTWATSGTYIVAGAAQLRGLAVASDGAIYVTQRDQVTADKDRLGTIYCISPALTQFSVPSAGPMDAAIYDGYLYVSEYIGTASGIEVRNLADLSVAELLSTGVPRVDDDYGYSGIDISDDGWIYVNDQWYDITGFGLRKTWWDRILTTAPLDTEPAIPEPASLLLLTLGLGALARRRRSL